MQNKAKQNMYTSQIAKALRFMRIRYQSLVKASDGYLIETDLKVFAIRDILWDTPIMKDLNGIPVSFIPVLRPPGVTPIYW